MIETSLPSAGASVPVDAAAVPRLTARRILQLLLKTWPFIRPMLKHVLLFLATSILAGFVWGAAGLLASDLLNNKILVGEKLQPVQATLLMLDDGYVTQGVGGAEGKALMTQDQRKTVRNRMVVWFAIGAVVGLVLLATLPYYGTWVWHNVNQGLRVAMIERAEHLSLRYHSHARVGDAIFRVYQDSSMIINVVQEGIVEPLRIGFIVLLGLAFIVFFDPLVALMCVVTAVPMVWLTVKFTPRIRRRAWANRRANSDLTSRLQESFSAIKVVKANRAEGRILDRFRRDSQRALQAAFFIRLEIVTLSLLVMTIGGVTISVLEYLMASWVIEERETYLGALAALFVGFMVWNLGAFRNATGHVEKAVRTSIDFVRLWAMLQDLFVGLERAFFLLELEPEVVDPKVSVDFPAPVRDVSWHNVHFSYEGDRPVLQGVNLRAQAGTITAIVGATGSGKSTLMSMLLRLYDPDRGSVKINEVDLRDLAINQIRAHTAIALQKNVLFATSVADNIGYAATDASPQVIAAAARVACADSFIEEMHAGYDTELGERGGKLSSGQRQRLSIARAVVRDTPILILDEPTASLDAETEHAVLENLGRWGREKVVFVITHRLSTIRNADRIAFLEDGRIVEYGAHESLMAIEDGRYRRFIDAETGAARGAGESS